MLLYLCFFKIIKNRLFYKRKTVITSTVVLYQHFTLGQLLESEFLEEII